MKFDLSFSLNCCNFDNCSSLALGFSSFAKLSASEEFVEVVANEDVCIGAIYSGNPSPIPLRIISASELTFGGKNPPPSAEPTPIPICFNV